MIKEARLLCYDNNRIFAEELAEVINSFQSKGWEVEIQYSLDKGIFSALIIARDE